MHRRNIEERLAAALADTRVVLLNGARQAGKSTLVQSQDAQRALRHPRRPGGVGGRARRSRRARGWIRRPDRNRRGAARAGGFPEALARESAERRGAWFHSYLATLTQRDVRDLARIAELPRLLALLAAGTSTLANAAELSRSVSISHSTLRRYLGLLEAVFILQPLPAWSTNLGKRLVRSAKIHLVDCGLTAHLRGEADAGALERSNALGPLLETFVVQELRKQAGWSRVAARLYHYRTAAGREVDIVLEGPARQVAGVEVKASASVGAGDFVGLKSLAEAAGKNFVRGVVLYLGENDVAFGERLRAVPLPALWEPGAR